MSLPSKLLEPAELLFRAAKEAQVEAILIGGAAAMLNGSERQTGVRPT